MRSLALVLCLVGSSALAESAPPTPRVVPLDSAAMVPAPEKLDESAEAIRFMRKTLREVLAQLEEARASKDVVKLNCVNEKLTQIKGLLRISQQAEVNLQEAIARAEPAVENHEFRKVSIARNRVVQLRTEAEQCIGQLAFRTDQNLSVEVEVPTDLPEGDPTQPSPPPPITNQPPPASPDT